MDLCAMDEIRYDYSALQNINSNDMPKNVLGLSEVIFSILLDKDE